MSLFPGLVSVWVDWGDVQPSIHYFNQLTSLFFYLKISKPKFYFLKFEEYLKYSSYETWPHSPLQPQSLNQKEEEKAGVKPVRLWPGKPLELMRDKIMKWTEAGGNMRSVTATQSSYPYKKAISNVWSFPSLLPWLHSQLDPLRAFPGFRDISSFFIHRGKTCVSIHINSTLLSAPLPLTSISSTFHS